MKLPQKRYILWLYDEGGYYPTEYDTVEEALLADKTTNNFYITESINYVSCYVDFKKPEDTKKDKTPKQ